MLSGGQFDELDPHDLDLIVSYDVINEEVGNDWHDTCFVWDS